MAAVTDVTFEAEAIDGGVRVRLRYTVELQPWETGVWFTEEVAIVRRRRTSGAAPAPGRATVTSDPFVIAPRATGDALEPVRRQRRLPPFDIVPGPGRADWELRPGQPLVATITLEPCVPAGASATATATVPHRRPARAGR